MWCKALTLGIVLGMIVPGLSITSVAAQGPMPQSPGWDVVIGRCIPCHSLEIATQQRQPRQGWAEIVDRMISYGAPIPPEDRELILTYLAREFSETTAR